MDSRESKEVSSKLVVMSSKLAYLIFVTCTTCGAGVKIFRLVSKNPELTVKMSIFHHHLLHHHQHYTTNITTNHHSTLDHYFLEFELL